jgi:hypothetical protein
MHLSMPHLASLTAAIDDKDAMHAARRTAKRRRTRAMKLIEVERNELLSIACLEVSYKSGTSLGFVFAASSLGGAYGGADFWWKLLKTFA